MAPWCYDSAVAAKVKSGRLRFSCRLTLGNTIVVGERDNYEDRGDSLPFVTFSKADLRTFDDDLMACRHKIFLLDFNVSSWVAVR